MGNSFDSFFSEESLSEVWQYMRAYAGEAGREATKVVLELFFVMKSPETSMIDKGIIVAALAYQLLPEDFLSRERFGILSLLDNGVTIAFAYSRMKADVTPEIQAQVEAILNSWFGVADEIQGHGGNVMPEYAEVQQPNDYWPRDNTSPTLQTNSSRPYAYDDEDVIVD